MKKKKSRIELAREIIANLRRGMNRSLNNGMARTNQLEATPFTPTPFTPMSANRPKRSNQLQTSHW